MRPILILTLTLIALGTALIAVARGIGRMHDLPPTFLETGDCDQPCWQGFQPGAGLDEEALLQRSTELPYSVGRVSEYSGGYITMFEIYPGGRITLADIVRAWGWPEQVGCLQLGAGPRTLGTLYFFDGLVAVLVVSSGESLRLSPDMNASTIQYYQPGDPVYAIGDTTTWHGFATVPVYPACYTY